MIKVFPKPVLRKSVPMVMTIFLLILPLYAYTQSNQGSLDKLVYQLGNNLIKDQQAVGLSVGLYHRGNVSFYNFGSTGMGKSLVPTQHTVYEIGSITKTFVSYILAHAVLQQRVSLDDDIRRYLKDSYPNLEYNGHPIKLVHLANTTSLLPDWLPELPAAMQGLSPDSALKVKINAYKGLSKKDFLEALHTVRLDTIPGTKRYHSNAGAQLLAYILEDMYQMSMDELIQSFITHPQEMGNTLFITSDKVKNLATGYTAEGREAVYEFVMPYFKNAGGMASCTYDLVNYIRLMLDKNNPATALCLRKTVDVDVASGKVVALRSDGIAAPDVYSVVLSWFKYQPDATSSQIWADGGTNGFNSYLVIYPHLDSGIILLANKSDEKIFRALPDIAYQISKELDKK